MWVKWLVSVDRYIELRFAINNQNDRKRSLKNERTKAEFKIIKAILNS